MRAILNLSEPETKWQKEFFPEKNPYLLPFAAKPLLEFYLDGLSLSKVKSVLVVQYDYDEDVEKLLGDGSKWGLEISYTTASVNDSTETVIKKNESFWKGFDTLLCKGFFFPLYDKNKTDGTLAEECGQRVSFIGSHRQADCTLSLVKTLEVESVKDYFLLNLDILEKYSDNLVMFGYSAQKGVFLGMNDVIGRTAELRPQFIVGDNSSLEVNTVIGPMAIVGSSCIVDQNTSLSRAIIFDKTYVGQGLDIHDKILCGGVIIDPWAGLRMKFFDTFFLSSLKNTSTRNYLKRMACAVLAAGGICVMFIPFLLFSAGGAPQFDRIPFRTVDDRISAYRKYKTKRNFRGAWFRKLSLYKFPLLIKVVKLQMNLVGDTPWDIRTNSERLERYKQYAPAAFTYAESLGHENSEAAMLDDLFYKHNRTFLSDAAVVLRTIVGNLFGGGNERE